MARGRRRADVPSTALSALLTPTVAASGVASRLASSGAASYRLAFSLLASAPRRLYRTLHCHRFQLHGLQRHSLRRWQWHKLVGG